MIYFIKHFFITSILLLSSTFAITPASWNIDPTNDAIIEINDAAGNMIDLQDNTPSCNTWSTSSLSAKFIEIKDKNGKILRRQKAPADPSSCRIVKFNDTFYLIPEKKQDEDQLEPKDLSEDPPEAEPEAEKSIESPVQTEEQESVKSPVVNIANDDVEMQEIEVPEVETALSDHEDTEMLDAIALPSASELFSAPPTLQTPTPPRQAGQKRLHSSTDIESPSTTLPAQKKRKDQHTDTVPYDLTYDDEAPAYDLPNNSSPNESDDEEGDQASEAANTIMVNPFDETIPVCWRIHPHKKGYFQLLNKNGIPIDESTVLVRNRRKRKLNRGILLKTIEYGKTLRLMRHPEDKKNLEDNDFVPGQEAATLNPRKDMIPPWIVEEPQSITPQQDALSPGLTQQEERPQPPLITPTPDIQEKETEPPQQSHEGILSPNHDVNMDIDNALRALLSSVRASQQEAAHPIESMHTTAPQPKSRISSNDLRQKNIEHNKKCALQALNIHKSLPVCWRIHPHKKGFVQFLDKNGICVYESKILWGNDKKKKLNSGHFYKMIMGVNWNMKRHPEDKESLDDNGFVPGQEAAALNPRKDMIPPWIVEEPQPITPQQDTLSSGLTPQEERPQSSLQASTPDVQEKETKATEQISEPEKDHSSNSFFDLYGDLLRSDPEVDAEIDAILGAPSPPQQEARQQPCTGSNIDAPEIPQPLPQQQKDLHSMIQPTAPEPTPQSDAGTTQDAALQWWDDLKETLGDSASMNLM